jgi:hypothetical protein
LVIPCLPCCSHLDLSLILRIFLSLSSSNHSLGLSLHLFLKFIHTNTFHYLLI